MSEKERADMIKELLALADESVVEEQETENDNQPATDKKEEKSTKEDKKTKEGSRKGSFHGSMMY